ncbi:MAG: hypothetical protein U0931_04945 [Vulcanimicrobiota bacterium]
MAGRPSRWSWLVLPLALFVLGCDDDPGAYRTVTRYGFVSVPRVSTTTYTVTRTTYADYITRVLEKPGSPDSALYIPGYSYFQGFVYTPSKLNVDGQVRVIGGSAAGAEVELKEGAMVTTNPDCLKPRISPFRYRYRVVDWKEE